MAILEAVILAMIQGFTEFLPISSSAHLAMAPWLLGWKDQGLTFDIALHFGTLLAVLIYFYRDWLQITAQAFGMSYAPDRDLAQSKHMLWWMLAATIPVGISGLLLQDMAQTQLRRPLVIGGMLAGVGVLMLAADKVSKRNKEIQSVTLLDALVIGAAQALAVIPGTSRSGITVIAGLFCNLDRPTAARFSFLLSTPAIAAAAFKASLDVVQQGGIPSPMWVPFFAGITVSAITGLLVIDIFLTFLRRNTLTFFVCYRVLFGIIVIALAFFRGTL
ncbi:MAG: undecaprenyl-diphosphate phosphatase [Bryobacteraceae bacterium]|nr:undecaprenyl-diphosphate phosphatase [Bryobacteraceae bacterium]